MPRTPRLLLTVPLLACTTIGCTSSGYERANSAANKTAVYHDRVVRLGDQIGLTLEALHALEENPGDSPRSNGETFETFERELANLESLARSSRKSYGRMDARAESFFGSWNEESSEIADADLKQSAEQRRAALRSNYAKLAEGQRAVDQELDALVRELNDLRTYLEHDLTAAGLASVRPSIAKVTAHGEMLQARLDAQARSSEAARESLTPLQELAPSQQRWADGSSVR